MNSFNRFLLVALGQAVSLTGTGLTTFALGLDVFRSTGSVTRFALISLFASLPGVLLSPIAGVFVDRWNRRRALALADGGAALVTALLLGLVVGHRLATWHVYLASGLLSALNALHWPAYSALTAQIVPTAQLGRANGIVQLGEALAQILAPMLAGVLMTVVPLPWIVGLDCATYVVAAAIVLSLEGGEAPAASAAPLFTRELSLGWHFIVRRRGLIALLLVIAGNNFSLGILQPLLTPLVLSFATPRVLGMVLASAGAGMLAGGATLAIWGGPRRPIHGVLAANLFAGAALFVSALAPRALLIGAGAFALTFAGAVLVGCSQSIWQRKVPLGVQGRVFAVRRMIAQISWPFGALAAGPLAERVFAPLVAGRGAAAHLARHLVGIGPGRDIALLFAAFGVVLLAIAARGYAYPPLRNIDRELPDEDVATKAAA